MSRPAATPGRDKSALLQALREAAALQRAGRRDAAAAAYHAILAQAPAIPEAHHNLGVLYKAIGDLAAAEAAFRRAIELVPSYALAHRNLAATLARRGRHSEALEQALQAVRLEPEVAAHRRGLAAILPYAPLPPTTPGLRAILERCFRDDGIEHQLLVRATLALLRHDPAIAPHLAAAGEQGPHSDEALSCCARDRLLGLLLTCAIVADESFERLLTLLRRQLLERYAASDTRPDDTHREFAAALACQCALVDYAYPETEAETATIEALAQRMAAPDAATRWDDLVLLALYRPTLEPVASARFAACDLPEGEMLALLQRRLLREPARERELAASIPSVTPVTDAVSAAVKQQYEEHPYPRWLATRARPARSLTHVVADLFPHVAPLPPADRPVSILVAGCGTGKHAIDVATRYSHAQVLAVDLSRRSLAYGRRQAEERKLANLRFAQADILALGDIVERFDLIESVGVLHHLADPLAGWRTLLGLLKAGGFMRIGLYSTRGRGHIEAARSFVAEAGFTAAPESIRAARQAILALPPYHPARRVAGELDFYSLTACRDLLFNVQERSYSLAELRAALDELSLTFLGFEQHDPAIAVAYAQRFPEDRTKTELTYWDAFESEHPTIFGQMYQFWCRRD